MKIIPCSQHIHKTIGLALYLYLLGLSTHAQHNLKFQQLNEQHGLSNVVINDIAQDTLGFMWVATEEGLFRYDGDKFSPFREKGTDISIPNNTVNKVKVDQRNRVWILTNGGLGMYDYKKDSLQQYFSKDYQTSVYEKVFTAIAEADDGAIYLGTSGGGLYTVEKDTLLRLYPEDKSAATDFSTVGISDLEIQDGRLWIGTWGKGLRVLNLKTKQLQTPTLNGHKDDLLIYDIFCDSNSHVWIGTDQGLKYVEAGSVHGYSIESLPDSPEDTVLSILEDGQKTLWLGTRNSGMFQLNTASNGMYKTSRQFKAGLGSNKLSHRTISKIFEDTSGNIWLGTHSKGLTIFNPYGERISHLTPPLLDLLTENNITSIWGMCPSDQGGIWLGTDGAGLYHYNREKDQWVKFASTKGPVIINDDNILVVNQTDPVHLWLGTYAGGLYRINLLTREVFTYAMDESANALQSNDIRSIHQDRDANVWIGTNRGGLHLFDPLTDKIISITNTHSLDIRGILDDPVHKHILWLATYGDGLVKFNKIDQSITVFNWNIDNFKEIPVALSIAYNRNHLWVGTKNRGLLAFSLETESFQPLTSYEPLTNSTIRNIVPVGKHLVLSTNIGISMLDLETDKILKFTSIDGLNFGQFNDGSGFFSEAGYLAFGGVHGLYIIDPNLRGIGQKNDDVKTKFSSILSLLEKREIPKIVFTDLLYNNEKLSPKNNKGILTESLPIAQTLRFDQELDIFSVKFNALDFRPFSEWNYSYFLEGYDMEWNLEEMTGLATYRNVPPGNYVFKARVSDASTGQLGPISSIAVRIAPPWWQTNWAYTGFILVGFSLMTLVYRYKRERITMRQKLYYEQKIRQQESTSMEEKMRFYTNFSHELRTPITLILGPVSSLLQSDQLDDKQLKSLHFIKRNANMLLRLINRLLDFRKIETANIVLNIGHYDLSVLAKEEAESFEYLAKESGNPFGFYSETDLMAWVDIEKIQIILNNLLSNALKFSEKGKKVTFKVYDAHDCLRFDVIDEGKGISEEEVDLIFKPFFQAKNSAGTGGSGLGLSLSKSLTELHHGSLEVTSQLSKGTVFSLKIPKGRSHFEENEKVRFIKLQKGEIEDVSSCEKETKEVSIVQNTSEQVLLVVDDNADIRAYIGSLFQDSFTVLFAENGKKALDISKEVGPDMVISDIMMPVMDGYTFCKELKKNMATSHIPVLLLTAKGDKQGKIEGYQEGADDYITKPFDPEVLIVRVNNMLHTRAQLKQRFENNQWPDLDTVNAVEIAFLNKVESTVLAMIPTGDLNVIDLCKELGFSRTSLYRKVKSLTGLSINQLIRSIKIKRAAQMLVSEDMNVSEVAFSLDFTDLKYFRNAFKKQYAMMPSEYMKVHKPESLIDQEAIKKQMNF